jgi:hypothetical protein
MASPFKLRSSTPIKRYVPKLIKHEEALQRQVCHWLRLNYPNVNFRSDYASGLHLTPHQARTHASLQSGRSWPDLFIYKRCLGYGGLPLELKVEGTKIHTRKNELVRVSGAKWKRPVERFYRISLPLKHADSLANRLNLKNGNPLEWPVERVLFRTANSY